MGWGNAPHVVEATLVSPNIVCEIGLQVVGTGQGEGDAELQPRERISIVRHFRAIGGGPWPTLTPSAASIAHNTGLARLPCLVVAHLLA